MQVSARNPLSAASSKVGARRTESLRLAVSMAQPIGMLAQSTRTDYFHPSFDLSVGFLPVPSPPQELLCNEPSNDTSERSSPMTRS